MGGDAGVEVREWTELRCEVADLDQRLERSQVLDDRAAASSSSLTYGNTPWCGGRDGAQMQQAVVHVPHRTELAF